MIRGQGTGRRGSDNGATGIWVHDQGARVRGVGAKRGRKCTYAPGEGDEFSSTFSSSPFSSSSPPPSTRCSRSAIPPSFASVAWSAGESWPVPVRGLLA